MARGKRKLSTAAVIGVGKSQNNKKAKKGHEPAVDEEPAAPALSSKDEPETKKDDADAGKAKSPEEIKEAAGKILKHTDDPQGKATFYLWEDALLPWLDDSPEELVFRLKSAVHEAWTHLKDIPEEEREDNDLVFEQASNIQQWYFEEVEDEDEVKQEQARKMKESARKIYDDFASLLKAKQAKGKDEEKCEDKQGGDKKEDGEKLADDSWWWQLELQRDRPAKDTPAVEVKLDNVSGDTNASYDGQWWWTGFRPSDDVGAQALTLLSDYLATNLA